MDIPDAAEAVYDSVRQLAASVDASADCAPEDVADALDTVSEALDLLPGILERLQRRIEEEASTEAPFWSLGS
ncbi:hypothetical protein [Nocardiopsis potens]|uniref:hypothetical protein n=1 Tax=Nocardiopsis potens TaxID=1246458 RepID=UPI00034BFBB9|nr:hypothetical protein [Nocardiopsis potens]